jgi:uncharacterized protein (DUF1015 family)
LVDVRPFKALKYTAKAGNPETLVTQPYDKIDSEMQKEYYEKSPYNYCRLILPTEADKYNIAAQRIEQWLKDGALTRTEQPAIFVSRQEYSLHGKKRLVAYWLDCCTSFVSLQRKHGFSPRVHPFSAQSRPIKHAAYGTERS